MAELRKIEAELQANKAELQVNKAELQAELQANAREIAEVKEQMRANIQLVMSKMQALSTQNQHAPGIFDGAEFRKQEQEKMKGGSVAVRHRQIAYFDM